MTEHAMRAAREVADAVLYEGYLLYPYRASATKNRVRWQFGVLLPPGYAQSGTGEHATAQTECLLEAEQDAVLHARVRFLQLATRPAAGDQPEEWDEAGEREIDVVAPLAELLGDGRATPFTVLGGTDVRDGGPRRRQELSGRLWLRAERIPGPYGPVRLRAEVANTSGWAGAAGTPPSRDEALRHSLVASHTLLAVTGGTFLSLLDPPEWARPAAEACQNIRTWPVLVGDPARRDAMLSSPIILYDYPTVAPESVGQLFDSTEIDELLSLRTLALTDAEKRAARATDPRAAELIDRVEAMPPELLERLHGAIRSVPPAGRADPGAGLPDPDTASPETDSIQIAGHRVARGSTVRLAPGHRRADAQDMFLVGRLATVQAVLHDVDDGRYLAVTLDDDPGADLHVAHGRFRYFAPDEVEPQPAAEERR